MLPPPPLSSSPPPPLSSSVVVVSVPVVVVVPLASAFSSPAEPLVSSGFDFADPLGWMTVVVVSSPPHAEIPIPAPIPNAAVATMIAARFIRPLSLACKWRRTLPESVGTSRQFILRANPTLRCRGTWPSGGNRGTAGIRPKPSKPPGCGSRAARRLAGPRQGPAEPCWARPMRVRFGEVQIATSGGCHGWC